MDSRISPVPGVLGLSDFFFKKVHKSSSLPKIAFQNLKTLKTGTLIPNQNLT
jgi:hypothetical protein